jgi:hypothetical protein
MSQNYNTKNQNSPPNILCLYLYNHFKLYSITTDDKERQDGVRVRIVDFRGSTLYDQEIVSPSLCNGDSTDPNKWYWPSGGPGKHQHSFTLPLSPPLALDQIPGCTISVISGYTGSTGDNFQSWAAEINVDGLISDGTAMVLLLSGNRIATLVYQDSGSPGTYTFEISK